MRRVFFRLHSWLGLATGIFLLIVGLSGSILVWKPELERLAHPQLFVAQPRGERAPLDAILAALRTAHPDHEARGMFLPKQTDQTYLVRFQHTSGRWKNAFVDPHTAEVRGVQRQDATFLDWLLKLHYTLLLGDWGEAFLGVIAVTLVASCLTGLCIYRRVLGSFFTLRWGRAARLLFSDAHKLIGFTSLGFNLILAGTGAWWNLPAFSRLSSSEKEATPPRAAQLYDTRLSAQAMLDRATATFADFKPTYFNLPRQVGDPFIVSGDLPSGHFLETEYEGEAHFDPWTGALLKTADARRAPWPDQLDAMTGPLHFGTFGGWPVKVLWCLGGLTPGALGVLGFLIWRARRVTKRETVSQGVRRPMPVFNSPTS